MLFNHGAMGMQKLRDELMGIRKLIEEITYG